MSSPTIVTFVEMPQAEAIAANKEATAHFLELAHELYEQAMRLREQSLGMGGKFVHEPIVPFEQAAAQANHLLRTSFCGMEGTKYAHAYWQSLKHPWFDQVVRDHAELCAQSGRAARAEAEAGRLREVASEVAGMLSVRAEVDRVRITASPTAATTLKIKVAAALDAVLQVADAEGLEAVRETAAQSARLPPAEQLVALETFRLHLTHQVKERRRQQALELYEAKQRELAAERIAIRVDHCRKKIEALESAPAAAALETELQQLAAAPPTVQVEERAQALDQKVAAAARQQSLLEAAVAALRRQGYETVQVMQTLGPPEIMSAYLQDPRDEERVALLQVAPEKGLVSAEVVRRADANGSQQQKNLDREAQGRLCQAMDAVEKALALKWKCEMKKQAPPGQVAPKVNGKIPAPGRRTRVAAALHSRAVG